MTDRATPHTDACPATDCETPTGRRAFLRDGLMAVAALTAIAGGAAPLHALSRSYVTGRRALDTITYPVPAADGATIDAANKVILVRFEGRVHAFSLECPHRKESLEWQPDNGRFFCPKHKSTFKPEGTLIQGKAERNLDRFAVRLEAEKVVVDTAQLLRSDREAEAWGSAAVSVN